MTTDELVLKNCLQELHQVITRSGSDSRLTSVDMVQQWIDVLSAVFTESENLEDFATTMGHFVQKHVFKNHIVQLASLHHRVHEINMVRYQSLKIQHNHSIKKKIDSSMKIIKKHRGTQQSFRHFVIVDSRDVMHQHVQQYFPVVVEENRQSTKRQNRVWHTLHRKVMAEGQKHAEEYIKKKCEIESPMGLFFKHEQIESTTFGVTVFWGNNNSRRGIIGNIKICLSNNIPSTEVDRVAFAANKFAGSLIYPLVALSPAKCVTDTFGRQKIQRYEMNDFGKNDMFEVDQHANWKTYALDTLFKSDLSIAQDYNNWKRIIYHESPPGGCAAINLIAVQRNIVYEKIAARFNTAWKKRYGYELGMWEVQKYIRKYNVFPNILDCNLEDLVLEVGLLEYEMFH
ncbi:MAG: hypothetical protein NZ811_04780 [Gammaproteobacteria bacterium]|nr:hypothetical protein [Gammaproteobacteria bacterium]